MVLSRPDANGVRYLRWRDCGGCHRLFETAEQVTGVEKPLPPDAPSLPV